MVSEMNNREYYELAVKRAKAQERKAMPTLGERRVRITFNPSQKDTVSQIKQETAKLIDLTENMRYESVRDLNEQQEKFRLINLAQEAYEEAAIWAVKAATM